MANFCLPKDRVNQFIVAMKKGDINPEELSRMSSEERNALFANIAGDEKTASLINAEFESKLLLKNQQAGYIRWAEKLTDVPKSTRRDLVSKIEKLDRVLTPQEEAGFLQDLANKKLGFEVTEQEAKAITKMSQKVQELKLKQAPDGTFPNEADRLAYGRAVVDMTDYVSELRNAAEALKASDFLKGGQYGKIISKGAGNLKAISASLDDSAVFRQGGKTFFTNPNIWRKNAQKTFGYLLKQVRGKDVLKEVNADIISRQNYDRYAKAKLAIYKAEEAFPESAAEKIPGFGRLFKASEAAYTGMLYRMRADLMDNYIAQAAKQGINVDDPAQLQAIGKVVNSLTGRASLGKAEGAATYANNLLFSPRYVKSQFDVLTGHTFSQEMTGFARKKAATNLVKLAAGTGSVLLAANTLWPKSVDWDPRSTDFLKIKIGDTRFDVTGGIGSLMVLAARATGESKTSSGVIKNLRDGGYGSQTVLDVLQGFVRGKLSPAASLATDVITGQDFKGDPITVQGEIYKALTPIGVQNAIEALQNPNSANNAAVILADFFGISANTYGPKAPDSWNGSTSKELTQFKEKVGADKFKQANQDFSVKYNNYVNNIKQNPDFTALSEEDKQYVLTQAQKQIKEDVLKSYNFEYKRENKNRDKAKSLLPNQ